MNHARVNPVITVSSASTAGHSNSTVVPPQILSHPTSDKQSEITADVYMKLICSSTESSVNVLVTVCSEQNKLVCWMVSVQVYVILN